MIEILFWLALVALFYGYVGYPLLVAAAGRLRGRSVHRAPVTPRMSVIIAAYNEDSGIAERLENVLAVDYPRESLEVIVVSDGSTDATCEIVERYASRGIRLLALPRQGKIPALNEAVRHATGELLVFSDANIQFHPRALRALARNFADPEVGGVAGNSTYRLPEDGESSSRGEGLYWRYDSWLKEMESRTGSIVSAHAGGTPAAASCIGRWSRRRSPMTSRSPPLSWCRDGAWCSMPRRSPTSWRFPRRLASSGGRYDS